MGNEISKKYDMDEEPSASGGLSCLWKIYSATEKVTNLPVSVHVFKKEELKDLDKAIREQVLDILRRELKTLTLVNTAGRPHPGVLRHVETFEESRTALAFVTERVACSLANAIGDGPTGGLPVKTASMLRRTFERYETARGFHGLVEGLQFVHTIKRRLHLNIAPESIFLAPNGQWKLGGFGFSVDLPSTGAGTTPCPYFQTGAKGGLVEGAWRLHPVMAFSSPEATASAGSSDVSCASDLFSLGCLMYQLCRDDPRGARLAQTESSPQAHQAFCSTLNYPGAVNVSPLFSEVQPLVSSLLQTNPTARPNLGNVTINPVFHGTEVTVLKNIDSIPGRNPAEAATFLTSVRAAVAEFPLRVQRDCIMHPLLDACAADESGRLWGSALPIVTDVCDRLDRREIITGVQAKFGPALKAEQLDALHSLILAMPLYLKKMEVAFFRSDVVPMVSRALQAQGNPQFRETLQKAVDVQEAALKAVSDEAFHSAIDGRTRELTILPRICWLVVKGTAPRVKVNALLCLSKTFHFYVVRAAVDKIMPTLKFAAERDQTVAIQLCVLGCYEAISKRLQRLGPVATHILPACTPILACPGLNSNQFDMVVNITQSMMQSVIAYRKNEIANPKATAIDTSTPTHPGGVADEEEIQRRRNAALGGWKPAPATPSAIGADSTSTSSSGYPASSPSAPAPAAASSSQGGFDIDDIFSSLPAPSASGSSTPSSGVLMPTKAAAQSMAASASMTGSSAVGVGDPFGGSPSSIFQDFSRSQSPAAAGVGATASDNNASPAVRMNGSASDPFASAGLGGGFNSPPLGGFSDSSSISGGMTWMSSTFGAGAEAPGGARGAGNGMGSPGRGFSGTGGMGGPLSMQTPAAAVPSGSRRPAPPVAHQASSSTGGDPFSAFFDAAMSGDATARAGGRERMQSRAAAPAAAGAVFGGVGGAPSQGFGAAPVGGGATGVGATLEDQLAKTQREIAQLTQDLATGAAVGVATAAMGQGIGGSGGGGGWGMPGLSTAFNGGGGNAQAQQTWQNSAGLAGPARPGPTPNTQNTPSDPFAFLDSGSQRGSRSSGQAMPGSGFDFLSK